MSIQEVAAQLDAAIEKADAGRGSLLRTQTLLADAAEILASATSGTSRPEAQHALALLADAQQLVTSILDTSDAAAAGIRDFRAQLAGPATAKGHQPTTRPEVSPPTQLTPERIDQLRRDLPPPVTPGSGQKTHGRWVGPDGRVHQEVSGKDQKYEQAVQVFEQDMKSRRVPATVVDVEVKLAAHMRVNGIRSATLLINNQPCRGPMGCDALLPVVLPPGYRLTVIGPNGFRREYRGGGTSKWVP